MPVTLRGSALSTAAVLLAAGLLSGPPAAAAALGESVLSTAETPVQRHCLAEATRLRTVITVYTGKRPQDTGFSTDYDEIVEACQAGRVDDAMDKRAVIWAALLLHLPHKS